MNITPAHLQGELEEDFYVKPPKYLTDKGEEEKIWKLRKNMNGLIQSGRIWKKNL